MKDEVDLARFDPKATYDEAAADYLRASQRFWGHLSTRTLERIALSEGGRVLDVPCGPGWSAIAAAARVGPKGRVVALDSSRQMLDLARQNAEREGHHNLDYRLGDMTRLDVPARSFDAVVSVLGIFFVPHMPDLVAELWRRVRPGGTLGIAVLGRDVFEPAFGVWKQAVADERADVLLSFPWQRTGDRRVVRQIVHEAGVPAPEITVEAHRVPLRSPADWWLAVMGSGMRRAVIELGAAAERVRERVAARLAEEGIDYVEVPGIYALATKERAE